MKQNTKYIYLRNEDGTVSPSGYLMENGQLHYVGLTIPDGKGGTVTLSPNMRASKILSKPNLFKLMPRGEFELNFKGNTKNENTAMNHGEKRAIQLKENVNGQVGTYREESAYTGQGKIVNFSIVLDYTGADPAAPDEIPVIIGDAGGLIEDDLGADSVLAEQVGTFGLKINGTYGDKTLSRLKQIISGVPYRVHYYQGTANADDYWDRTRQDTVEALPNFSFIKNEMPLNLFQDGTQFNEKIRRVDNFRFTMSTMTAIVQRLQKGDRVTLNFKLQSIGIVSGFELTK
jgi:hypothetical protein